MNLGTGTRFQKSTYSLVSCIVAVVMSVDSLALWIAYAVDHCAGGSGITALTSVRCTIHSPSTFSRIAR